MADLAVYCADCGTECERTTGRSAGALEPDMVDAQVWACPTCTAAWAPCAPDGSAIGLPAGEETRNARATTRERQVERLVAEALRASPNGRAIAEDRVASFLAHQLDLPPEDAALERLDLEWCRKAWQALRAVTYADVLRHAQTHRPKKPKKRRSIELPEPTEAERGTAAIAALALRAALSDPQAWGQQSTMHIDYSRPRRAEWVTTWSELPGLTCINGAYLHDLLPGWQYTRAELELEMAPDLEALAEHGIRPTVATSKAA